MSDVAIKIENLGKRYRYGGAESVSHNLRADLMEWARGLLRRPDRRPETEAGRLQSPVSSLQSSPTSPVSSLQSPATHHETLHEVHERHLAESPDYFWALRDINLEIKHGEVVGIIGRNGAGKSTLLKILSRITPPTTGKITYNGRMASLLEVGTGFHRELTGRENIFLNGSILGMKRSEIAKKFDEIVAFAEVEKFIDTPVKFYSSGMYVRLAFAVAAHLEPEILIVDEVLAVGDASFQKKCLGKMGDVAKQGRTILFVSHNMVAVQRLCSRGIFLDDGKLKSSGAVADIIANYISRGSSGEYTNTRSNEMPRILTAKVLTAAPRTDTALEVEIEWCLPQRIRNIKIGIGFNTVDGQRVFDSIPEDIGLRIPEEQGDYQAVFRVPPNTFMARQYIVSIGLWITPSGGRSTLFDSQTSALRFSVEAAPNGPYAHQATRDGLVHVNNCEWTIQQPAF